MRKHSFLISIFGLLVACGEAPQPESHAVTLMTFNVENLFDAKDDPDRDDWDYLPIALKQSEEHKAACAGLRFESWQNRCLNVDWNEDVVAQKLSVIAATIRQVNDGRGPDVIALQEVENVSILERLRTEYLAEADYLPAVLLEGNDSRGIDVAFLSRLPLAAEPQLHDLVFADEFADSVGDTRGILQADFEMPDGSVLTGFAVHFPAPYHPTEMRVAAYDTLNELRGELPGDRHVFAAGDFNTTSAEDGEKDMLERFARPGWTVSNDLCDGCLGTSYYPPDKSWSFLDMILWEPCCGADATWQIRADSVRIANQTAAQVREDGTPQRFSLPEGSGVSDHWPVVMTVESK
ncbi:MAG: endonuclease/exonuclease/phosphatase family protein [Woeseiaceae bacterium]